MRLFSIRRPTFIPVISCPPPPFPFFPRIYQRGGAYFLGDSFGVADLSLAPWFQRIHAVLFVYRGFSLRPASSSSSPLTKPPSLGLLASEDTEAQNESGSRNVTGDEEDLVRLEKWFEAVASRPSFAATVNLLFLLRRTSKIPPPFFFFTRDMHAASNCFLLIIKYLSIFLIETPCKTHRYVSLSDCRSREAGSELLWLCQWLCDLGCGRSLWTA